MTLCQRNVTAIHLKQTSILKKSEMLFLEYYNNVLDVIRNLHNIPKRKYISKVLVTLPPYIFPSYRIIVNPYIIKSNRRTLNILDQSSSSSSNEFNPFKSTLNTRKRKKKKSKTCCLHCKEKMSSTETTVISHSDSRDVSDSNIPPAPPLPSDDFLKFVEDEVFASTPQKRLAISDIKTVKLRPSTAEIEVPKTPEVSDMMAILRRRFAALHSSMFEDDDDSYSSDYSSENYQNSWGNMHNYIPIGIV